MPEAQTIAYVRPLLGSGHDSCVTSLGPGFYYNGGVIEVRKCCVYHRAISSILPSPRQKVKTLMGPGSMPKAG